MKSTLKTAAWPMMVALTLAAAASAASAAEYSVDPSHSHVGFTVRHMLGKVPGEFKDFEGTFNFDEKNPKTDSVKFSIKSASINTNNDKRDEHLRSPDFFDAGKFSTLTFESKKVAHKSGNKYKVDGDLTIHGVTKPASFDIEYAGAEKDPWGNQRASFSAAGQVNRKDFGIVWNKKLDSGSLLLGEDVKINLDVEGIQAQAKAK